MLLDKIKNHDDLSRERFKNLITDLYDVFSEIPVPMTI